MNVHMFIGSSWSVPRHARVVQRVHQLKVWRTSWLFCILG